MHGENTENTTLVQVAVAMDQTELALAKCALETAQIGFVVTTEHNCTAGPHPDFFPICVAAQDVATAQSALRAQHLERLLSKC